MKTAKYYIRKYGKKNLEKNRGYIQGACAALTGEKNDYEIGTIEYGAWLLGYEFTGGK